MSTTLLILLVVFQVKHFLADGPLQTPYMLKKGSTGLDWILPLLAHTSVHASLTFAIVLVYTGSLKTALGLALFDKVTHFVIDRIKASPNMLGRFNNMAKSSYWACLLGDQAMHHIVGFLIIMMMLK